MSNDTLLDRATALLTLKAGVLGALVLVPAAAVDAQTTHFTTTSSSFHTTTSGIPDYANSFGTSISSAPAEGNTSVSLWGDTGIHAKTSLAFRNYDDGPVLYRDGVTLKWNGTFSGDLVGDYYDAQSNYQNGDRIALTYDFSIERTNLSHSLNWEIQFEFDGSRSTVASGYTSGEAMALHTFSGSATSSNSLFWDSTPTAVNGNWSAYLVVMPYGYNVSGWDDADALRVIVSEGAFHLSIDRSVYYSAVPEPATWAVIIGSVSLGFVILRRRRAAV